MARARQRIDVNPVAALSTSVAGVTQVLRSEPVAGRDKRRAMKRSAAGITATHHVGNCGTGSAGTRVRMFGTTRERRLGRREGYVALTRWSVPARHQPFARGVTES